jgi:hypothetical protein
MYPETAALSRLDQQGLVEPLLRNCAFALGVNIESMRSAGQLSIDRYAGTRGSAWR